MPDELRSKDGGVVMTYDDAYERINRLVENGEMTEEEAREELWWAMIEEYE